MIIKDIKFAGFKSKDEISGLDLSRIEPKTILSERGENKNFLFKSLLGIIFGFSNEEKDYYRDRHSLVYTGLVDLKFEHYTLHIERDFETNIIALLSESEKEQKPVYQGKDDFNLPVEQRPYLEIIKSFFSINDKELLLKACETKLAQSKSTFGELLDTLYLFLRPKFKQVAIGKLIETCSTLLKNKNGFEHQTQISVNLQKAINRLHLLKIARRVFQSRESINADIEKFELFLKQTINSPTNKAQETLKQRFPLIYQMDAYQVKKDITFIHALQQSSKKVHQELQKLNEQKSDIENLIGQKLMVYSTLPDSFVDDFYIYQNLSIDLAQLKNEKDKKNILLGNYKADLNRIKNKNLVVQTILISVIVTLGLIFFPSKIYWVGVAAILTAAILSFTYFRIRKTKNILIDICSHEISRLKIKIISTEKNISELRKGSYLLDDLDFIDTHVERFQKYKHFRKQLKKIEQAKNDLQSQINNDKFKIILPRLEQQYKDLINLNPPEGLDSYLDEFKILQDKAKEYSLSKNNQSFDCEPVEQIVNDYQILLTNLDATRKEIEEYLGIDELEKEIDSQISYLERAITHLKQKIHLEKTS